VVPELRQLLVAELSLLALAEQIIGLTGSGSQIVHEALPIDDPKIRCPDITKAMHLLDWHPQVDLHDSRRAAPRLGVRAQHAEPLDDRPGG